MIHKTWYCCMCLQGFNNFWIHRYLIFDFYLVNIFINKYLIMFFLSRASNSSPVVGLSSVKQQSYKMSLDFVNEAFYYETRQNCVFSIFQFFPENCNFGSPLTQHSYWGSPRNTQNILISNLQLFTLLIFIWIILSTLHLTDGKSYSMHVA